jgi:hypothetical protein
MFTGFLTVIAFEVSFVLSFLARIMIGNRNRFSFQWLCWYHLPGNLSQVSNSLQTRVVSFGGLLRILLSIRFYGLRNFLRPRTHRLHRNKSGSTLERKANYSQNWRTRTEGRVRRSLTRNFPLAFVSILNLSCLG